MGGALILLCLLVPTMLWCDLKNPFVLATTAVTAGYGMIGYLDDYLKLKRKSSGGTAWPLQAAGTVLDRGGSHRLHLPGDRLPPPRLVGYSDSALAPLPCLQQVPHRAALVGLCALCRRGGRGLVQRCEPHRWARRLGHRPSADQRHCVPILGLCGRRGVVWVLDGSLPGHPAPSECLRTCGVLRGHGGRRHRVPLVQHLSRAGVHGRCGVRWHWEADSACSPFSRRTSC